MDTLTRLLVVKRYFSDFFDVSDKLGTLLAQLGGGVSAAVRDWTPGRPWNTRRPGLQSLPSGQGGVPKEDKPNQ